MTYLPDHEPALGSALSANGNGGSPTGEWTSGHDLSRDTDLLIHDAQYTADEYDQRVGWGHSQIGDAVALAALAGAKRLVTFHHDPAHDDAELDQMLADAQVAGAGRARGAARPRGHDVPHLSVDLSPCRV